MGGRFFMSQEFALKILSDNGSSFRVGGYGVIFGGHDVTKERFTKATDFWFDRITRTPPVLYQHGTDDTFKKLIVGQVSSTVVDEIGVWVEGQITAAKQYADAIRQLIAKGHLGWSSGSVPHLVHKVKSDTPGVTEITSWPIVEFSLTPTPAEPRTVGVRELKSLAAIEPLLERVAQDAAQAELITDARTKPPATTAAKDGGKSMELPDSAYAFVEAGALDQEKKTVPRSNRHYAHHDESGAVDHDALHAILSDAVKSSEHPLAIAHLQRHAMTLAAGSPDDTHAAQWAKGAAPAILTAIARLSTLAEDIAGDRLAMERLGLDTKSGDRINGAMLTQLKTLVGGLKQVADWAENIERGEDGKARVDMFRHKLAMLQLEEVS